MKIFTVTVCTITRRYKYFALAATTGEAIDAVIGAFGIDVAIGVAASLIDLTC